MSKSTSKTISPQASGALKARCIGVPAALLIASGLILFSTGCGGGPAYVGVGVGTPCYPCGYGYGGGYGYGYGYGYGAISTVGVAGTGGAGSSSGAAASNNQGFQPVAMAFDASGNLFVADPASNTVRKVAAQPSTTTATSPAVNSDSIAKAVAVGPSFNHPSGIAVDPSGNVYVLDKISGTVRRMSPSNGAVVTVVGSGVAHPGFSGDNGPAISAQLNNPSGVAFDPSGNMFIADTGNHRVREVAAKTGLITTFAGSGSAGYSGDGGSAIAAEISSPSSVVADSKGNVYISDAANGTVREVNAATGTIATVAGTGTIGYAGDSGQATSAQLNNPQGLALDPYGNLFISDTGNQSIREVAFHTGIITTVAGNHTQGYSGDGGASAKAQLNTPYADAIDASGNLYIADSNNGAIRKVLPDPQSTSAQK